MTEQEKRGKEIEEMASDVRFAMRVPICDDNGTIYGERMTTSPTIISERLLNIGYRKEEEVRKETAKEILLRVKSFLEEQTKTVKQLSNPKMGVYAIPQSCVECYEGSQDNRLDELSRIAKEFGVEVEE